MGKLSEKSPGMEQYLVRDWERYIYGCSDNFLEFPFGNSLVLPVKRQKDRKVLEYLIVVQLFRATDQHKKGVGQQRSRIFFQFSDRITLFAVLPVTLGKNLSDGGGIYPNDSNRQSWQWRSKNCVFS